METEAAGETIHLSSLSCRKEGKMTKIFLAEPDEEAIVDFVKDHKELYGKTMSSSRTRQGWTASRKALPGDANSLSKPARHGFSPKGYAIEGADH